jgi:hypothetical protein
MLLIRSIAQKVLRKKLFKHKSESCHKFKKVDSVNLKQHSRKITHIDNRTELFKTIEHHLQICCTRIPSCRDLI